MSESDNGIGSLDVEAPLSPREKMKMHCSSARILAPAVLVIVLLLFAVLIVTFPASYKTCSLKGTPSEPFSSAEVVDVLKLFEANLDVEGSGMVVASPDHDTPGGDYYFDWMRDGALSMHALLQVKAFDSIETKMDHWATWVERSIQQADAQGTVMTEPKFVIPSGLPYSGSWCRPQTDGPGLRAITLIAYARAKPSIKDRVWNSIRQQLDWVAANYMQDGCDLWEEVRSDDFFWNRYTMRKALLQGREFAKEKGDEQRAIAYADAAKTITDALQQHIDDDGFVFESTGRRVDTAVVEAFNVGDMGDGVFAPLSKEVIQTLFRLTQAFCQEYPLNYAARSGDKGVLYGRYPGDIYAGGNPWVLLTASVANLLYRQAEALAKGAAADTAAADTLRKLLGQSVSAENLLGAGDLVLKFMRAFLRDGLHMNEQIDKFSGELTSARDLTWNYANVLKAMEARTMAVAAISAVRGEGLVA